MNISIIIAVNERTLVVDERIDDVAKILVKLARPVRD